MSIPIRLADSSDRRLDVFRGLRHASPQPGRVVIEGVVTVARLLGFGIRIDTLLTIESRVERLRGMVGRSTDW